MGQGEGRGVGGEEGQARGDIGKQPLWVCVCRMGGYLCWM